MIRSFQASNLKVALPSPPAKSHTVAVQVDSIRRVVGDHSCNDLPESEISFSTLEKRKNMISVPTPAPNKSPRSVGKKSPSPREVTTNNREVQHVPRNSNEKRSLILKHTTQIAIKPRVDPIDVNIVCKSPAIPPHATATSPRLSAIAKDKLAYLNRSRRVLTFCKRVKIRKIKLVGDMLAEELESMSYTHDELVVIRNALRDQIRVLVDEGCTKGDYCNSFLRLSDGDEDLFCIRGLEQEFPEGKIRRRRNKLVSRDAVLDEQQIQRSLCKMYGYVTSGSSNVVFDDPDIAIAEAYQAETRSAVQYAIEVAQQDEAIATEIYASDFDNTYECYLNEGANDYRSVINKPAIM